MTAVVEVLRSAGTRLVLPTTDLGVVVQLVAAVLLIGWLGWRVRHRPSWRLVVIGVALVLLGLFGVRAAH